MTTAYSNGGRVPEITAGMRIHIAIKDAGLEVGQVADELDIDRTTLSRWINGRHIRPVPTLYLRAIAERCGVDYEWLKDGAAPRMRRSSRSNHSQEGSFLVGAA